MMATLPHPIHDATDRLSDSNAIDSFQIRLTLALLGGASRSRLSSIRKFARNARGPQHDVSEPRFFGGRFKWTKALQKIDPNAILHPSVYERFAADRVQHFYEAKRYRLENLSQHEKLKQY